MESLKSLCEQWLGANLTIESVTQTLLLSELFSATKLKASCIEFITVNSKALTANSANGAKPLDARPDLLVRICEAFFYKPSSPSDQQQ